MGSSLYQRARRPTLWKGSTLRHACFTASMLFSWMSHLFHTFVPSLENASWRDYRFATCELPRVEGQTETLSGLALTVASVVGFIVSKPRRGLSLVLAGQRPPVLSIGRWSSRPHIHLLRFADQADSARVNEDRHRSSLGCLLARVPRVSEGAKFLVPSLRQFDDYGMYMNQAVRLWVYTPNALMPRVDAHADPNFDTVVYGQQAVAELLEYAYALHAKLVETARDPLGDPRTIANLRVLLAELSSSVDRHVHPGEIRDLLRQGYIQMGIPEMKEEVTSLLGAKNELLLYEQGQRSARWSTFLTFIFGLLAVPAVATDILTPLWRVAGWWKPPAEDVSKVFFISVAVTIVTSVLLSARMIFLRRSH
jgi:hypothetical protein